MFVKSNNKKVDYEALNSALMRIPHMNVSVARNLIDLGICEIYQLRGRSPEILLEDTKNRNTKTPDNLISYFRMAVYFAECDLPESSKLHPDAWK